MYHRGPEPVTPEERLILMNDVQWEEFIHNCTYQLKKEGQYIETAILGGAGDKGRDVCGYTQKQPDKGTWDLYQGKHYGTTLSSSQFLPDAAKFISMVYNNHYTCPSNYFICTLRLGTSLFDHTKNPNKMKAWLLKEWKAKKGKFKGFSQPLSDELEEFILNFDFKVFAVRTPTELLDIHSRNKTMHWQLFGILAERDPNPVVPIAPDEIEQRYILQLVSVYKETLGKESLSIQDIELTKLSSHFKAQRRLFYCAEGLNRFSRDKLPGAFDALLDQLEIGLSSTASLPYKQSLDKVTSVLQQADTLPIGNIPLKDRIESGDLQGSCHHLVNKRLINWVDDE